MIRAVAFMNIVVLTLLLPGCGDATMGEVSGTVTMDGKPLGNAGVTFQPQDGNRMSQAMTDTNGNYTLQFSSQTTGAKVGEHKVSISTFQPVTYTNDGYGPPTPEIVPMKYNKATTLTAQVDSGSNTIDFELDSQGEIYQQSALTGDSGSDSDADYGG